MLRPSVAALFAAAVFCNAPVFAQDTVTATPPPVVNVAPPPPAITPAPAPAPTPAPAPPPAVSTAPPAAAPTPVRTRPTAAPTVARTARTATRTPVRATPVRTRAEAPVRQAAPVRAAPAPAQPAPEAAPVPAPPPAAETPIPPAFAPPPAPVADATPAPVQQTGRPIWPWLLAGAGLLIVAIGLFMRRRRRQDDEVYEEAYYEAPAATVEPVADYQPPIVAPQPIIARSAPVETVVPIAAAEVANAHEEEDSAVEASPDPDAVSVTESEAAEVEALAEGSEPPANRPWIELLMRPVRAGTSPDDAIVQFELTVGNTGSVDAKDVRISTWMFAAGSAQESEMERMLIEPPADATVSNIDIDAGEGAKVEAEIMLPTAGLHDTVLPVVVADARYRLPDGSEGRTSASFAIGLPDGETLSPFSVDRASGLRENAEARLHGEPQRV